jgi:hypothetical protein
LRPDSVSALAYQSIWMRITCTGSKLPVPISSERLSRILATGSDWNPGGTPEGENVGGTGFEPATRSAVTERSQDRIEHQVQVPAHVFSKEAQHQVSVFL